ncbi:hypothetical protein NJB1907f44_49330 [Mycobacterium marinum]|nr:hypothetical protein NJB1907f34b_34320 [Mycobacterium marinum]GJO10957.1 hypothetical protein NJB1907E90_30250 [Mycobacterium marinum]GJO19085.1 hypothetical protein NJB1907E11_24230 [Mycobacterium marinum]GJO27815.1 hypothetical protein NJB1728e18_38820 [Mycobacterium marinum]GJO36683.1 hypothetical protein NJB1907f22_42940 [Mycobacterium marinum]
MGLLIAGDTDKADPRLRQRRMRFVDHAQSGAQHRNQKRGLASRRPVVAASGVRIATDSVGAARVAS